MQKTLTMTTWQEDENIISFWYLSIDTFYFGDNEYNNMFVSFNKVRDKLFLINILKNRGVDKWRLIK